MKDPVFTGKDVAEAVRLASRTLALPEASLRYVVLDPGQPGGRGLSPTEARIAVLIERVAAAGRTEAAAPDTPRAAAESDWDEGRGRRRARGSATHRDERVELPVEDPSASVHAVVRELARASGVDLAVEVSDGREGVEVRLAGPGTHVFFDPRGEALAAFEHVIDRLYGRALAGRRVRVRCAGYREYRDELLRDEALELAREVRADGQARTTGPLNAYERRVIHVTLEGQEGVTTFSVGEGQGRRVTVAPQARAEADAHQAPEPGATGQVEAPVDLGDAVTREPEPDVAPEQDASRAAEPLPATTAVTPAPFDPKIFDRPPQGGGASELM